MNPLFNPNREREAKTGLERHRKLVEYGKSPTTSQKMANIPNDWFYNEQQASKNWEDLEHYVPRPREEKNDQHNNFAKIERQSELIRQIIDNFEMSDSDFITHIMEIIDSEVEYTDVSEQEFLLDAKVKLTELLNSHSLNGTDQTNLLASLHNWFKMVKQDLIVLEETDAKEGMFDASILAQIVNDSFENQEKQAEKAMIYHRNIVDQLSRDIRELTKTVNIQKEEIDQLKETLNKSSRSRKKSSRGDQTKLLKKIAEQEYKINSLRESLSNAKFDLTNKSTASGTKTPNNEEEEKLYDEKSERILILEQTIRDLNVQIKQMNTDNQNLQQQLYRLRTNEISNENKIATLERQRNALDQTIRGMSDKFDNIEAFYKDELNNQREQLIKELSPEAQLRELNMKHQREMAAVKEQLKKQFDSSAEKIEMKYKMQMDQLLKAVDSKDTEVAAKIITEVNDQKIQNMKAEMDNYVLQLKETHSAQITSLTRYYETSLKKVQEEAKLNERKMERAKEIEIDKQKWSIEEENAAKSLKMQSDIDESLSNFKKQVQEIRSQYDVKLHELQQQNEKLTQIIHENELEEDLLNINQESVTLDFNKIDSVIDASMKAMRANEIEKGINERLTVLLESQRNQIDLYRKWQEESSIKESFKTCKQEVSDLRANLMLAVADLKQSVDKGEVNSELLEKSMVKFIDIVKGTDDKVNSADNKGVVIPMSEVDVRFTQANDQIINLINENKVLTMMLSKLSGDENIQSTKEVIDSLVKSASEIEEKLKNQIKENDKLKKVIEELQMSTEKIDVMTDAVEAKIDAMSQCVIDLITFDQLTTVQGREYNDIGIQKDKNVTPLVHGSNKLRPRKAAFSLSPTTMICDFHPAPKKVHDLETVCDHCHHKFDINPAIFNLASTVDPVVECPHCHSSHTISSKGSSDRIISQDSGLSAREKEIVDGVKELIDMKKLMRANSTKNTPIPSIPTSPTVSSSRSKLERTNSQKSCRSFGSDIEMDPALKISRPSTPKVKIVLPDVPSLQLSGISSFEMNFVHAFTIPPSESEFTPEQVEQITNKEKEINSMIDDLIEYKSKQTTPRIQTCDAATSTFIEFADESTNTVPPSSPVKLSPKTSKVELKLEPRKSSLAEPREEAVRPPSPVDEIYLSFYDCDPVHIVYKKRVLIPSSCISYEIFTKQSSLSLHYNSDMNFELIKQKLPKSKSQYGPISEIPLVKASLTISQESLKISTIDEEEKKLSMSSESFDVVPKAKSMSKFSTDLSIINEKPPREVPAPRKLYSEGSQSIFEINEIKTPPPEKANEGEEDVIDDDSVMIKKDDLVKMRNDNESLKIMQRELSNFTQDLVARHQEIVEYLVASVTKTASEGGKKSNEFAAQLAVAIKEREIAMQDVQNLTNLLQEKQSVIDNLTVKMTDKDAQIIDIMNDNRNLQSAVEKYSSDKSDAEKSLAIYNANDRETREHLESLTKAIENETLQKGEFQNELSKAKIEIERLLAKVQYYESEKAVDYSIVDPFVIFSTSISDLPQKGFGLSPSIATAADNSSSSTDASDRVNIVPQKPPKSPDLLKRAGSIIQTSVQLTKPKDSQAKLIHPKSRQSALRSPKLPNFSTLVPMKTSQGTLQYTSINKGHTGYYERNGVEYKPVSERIINNMKNRLDNLDVLLAQKANECNEISDAKQRLLVQISRLQQDNQTLSRELKKLSNIHESTRTRLSTALQIIEDKEEEIRKLRRIISELQKSANTILSENHRADVSESAASRIEDRAERARRAVAELQEAYKGTSALRRFAQRQLLAISRWEAQRKELIESERRHTMAVLSATGLICIQADDHRVDIPVKINSLSTRNSQSRTRPSTVKSSSPHPRRSTTPSSKNILKQGVVAIPLSTK